MAHKITFKYQPGDTVFFMHNNKIARGTVVRVKVELVSNQTEIIYRIHFTLPLGGTTKVEHINIKSEDVYATRPDLLKNLSDL